MSVYRLIVAIILPALLAGCFFIPGKFTSNMDVRRDGRFTFAYKGELIFQLPDEKMIGAETAKKAEVWNDKLAVCWSDDSKEVDTFGIYVEDEPNAEAKTAPAAEGTAEDAKKKKSGKKAKASKEEAEDESPVIRKCTAAEIAELKEEWEESQKKAAADEKAAAQMLSGITGVDPTDPESMKRFAADLQKQAGWRSVVYQGKGVFLVDYYHSSRLEQDFVFPLLPNQQLLMPFVMIKRRANGAVLVETPGYALGTNGGMYGAMGAVFASSQNRLGKEGEGEPRNPLTGIDGKFTLTTDGEILTNNTTDGPTSVAGQKGVRQLNWEFNDAKDPAPFSLIQLK